MTADDDALWARWPEVDALLAEALDLEEGARARLLERRRRDDPELVESVRRLLTAADAPAQRLDALPSAAWRALDRARSGDRSRVLEANDRVGPYRVLDELGRGGMATVYRAERVEGGFQQEVALKVLRRGLDTEEIVRRFVAERQILSELAHPNIARLLDGGSTADGRPWLAMERVEGRPIDEWALEPGRSRAERLELVLQVGDAVQFAHTRLVVHRDLKPSNVLVDRNGRAKLLDFGIAKLLDPEGVPVGDLTRTGSGLPLTPAYASPEQLRGEAITTASDVFQLGRLLYEIVSGTRPFVESDLTHPAGDRTASPPELPAELRGDLGRIVRKALRREPERRYASVEQFMADVRRFLAGHPVSARPDSVGYRASRFVARHPAGVVGSVVAMVLLVAFAVTASVQARRLAEEGERVRQEAARAMAARDLLTDVFEVADPDRSQGETVTARELLDAGAARVRRDLAAQPRLQAEMLGTIGGVYHRLGLYDRARPLLEEALRVHRSGVVDEVTGELALLRGLAASTVPSDREVGIAFYEEALALAEAELGDESPEVATILTELAPQVGDDPEREGRMLERAVRILRDVDGEHRAALAEALTARASALIGPESLALHREALALRRELYGDDHTSIAASLNNLALSLEPTEPLAADSLLSMAVDINLRRLGPEHSTTLAMMNSLAGFRRDRGDFAGAEPLYRQVLEIRQAAYPGQWREAYPLHGLGWVLSELGRAEEGEPFLRRSLALLEGQLDAGHPLVHIARSSLGRCLAVQGRFAEAELLLVEAFEAVARPELVGPLNARTLRERVVEFYEATGRPGEADRYRSRS